MQIIRSRISLTELRSAYCAVFQTMSKAVVDTARHCMAVDAELHADEEAALLDDGSMQEDLWGINLYPGKTGDDLIEFTSLINIRPSLGNPSEAIVSEAVRRQVAEVVRELVAFEA
jgi:hypothetical protein